MIGSEVNHRELLDLIDVVDRIDWSEVPINQARRGTSRDYRSTGRSDKAGDFVGFDPYTRTIVYSVTAGVSSFTASVWRLFADQVCVCGRCQFFPTYRWIVHCCANPCRRRHCDVTSDFFGRSYVSGSGVSLYP